MRETRRRKAKRHNLSRLTLVRGKALVAQAIGVAALCLGAVPAKAASLDISLQLVKAGFAVASESVVLVGRRMTPHGLVDEVERSLSVPATVQLALSEGGEWSFSIRAEQYWARPKTVMLDDDKLGSVQLLLHPTGILKGSFLVSGAASRVEELEVRFTSGTSSATRSTVEEEPAGEVRCSVSFPRFQCSLPVGWHDLRLSVPGMAPTYLWQVSIRQGKETQIKPVTLVAGGSVAGWVSSDSSIRLEETRVTLRVVQSASPDTQRDASRLRSLDLHGQVGERGFFQFRGVPSGVYEATAAHPNTGPGRARFEVMVRGDLEVELKEPVHLPPLSALDVHLDPPTGPGGAPWRVWLVPGERHRRETERGWEGESLAGIWRQERLAAGRYSLIVRSRDGSTWWKETLEVGAQPKSIFIDLPVLGMAGRVSASGVPVPGTVVFTAVDGGRRIQVETDDEGEFSRFLVGEGLWRIEVRPLGAGESRLSLPAVGIEEGRGGKPVWVEIELPETQLSGQVVDDLGNPVPGAQVTAIHTGERSTSGVTADSEGKFEFQGLPPGVMVLQAEAGSERSANEIVTVQEKMVPPDLRLVIRDHLEVEGRVIAEMGPVPAARVLAWPELVTSGASEIVTRTTGPRGDFRFPVPTSATAVTLVVAARGYATRILSLPVGSGEDMQVAVQTSGGELVIDGSASSHASTGNSAVLIHQGTVALLPLLRSVIGTRLRPGVLSLGLMEPGDYQICLGGIAATARGGTDAAASCSSGTMVPGGALTLQLPATELAGSEGS